MASSYVASGRPASRSSSFFHLPSDLAAVILFSLLGLVIAAALIAYQAADEVGPLLGALN